jgi:energy-coupling factor transport system ATP-binding protein
MSFGTALSLEGAEFHYPASEKMILCGLDLEIRAGEWVAVLGPNGSGKSTMLKLFNALLIPTQGICFVGGMDTKSEGAAEKIRQQAALVFQNPEDQIVAAIVEEDTAFGPENLGLPPEEIQRRVKEALEAVGLLHRRRSSVSSLSGGQKQRLALAGALAMAPSCLLLDEATSMLDPEARADFLALIKREHSRGRTVVQVTHRLEEIAEADRVVVLEAGKSAWSGTPNAFLSKPEEELDAMGFEKPPLAVLRDELAARGAIPGTTLPTAAAIRSALCR